MRRLLYLLPVLFVTACGQSQSTQTTFLSASELSPDDLNRELAAKPMRDLEGMKFTVPYDRYRISYGVELLKFDGSSPATDTFTTVKCGDMVGQVFTFEELVARTIDGRERTLAVLTNDGTHYASVINEPLSVVKSPDYFGQIPGLANLSLIEQARKLLVGRTMFGLHHEPHDTDTTNSAFVDNNDYIYLPKYVPVTIRNVEAGQLDSPFRVTVEYKTDNLIHTSQYRFGGSAPTNGRELTDWRFTQRYSFADPREKHKDLDDSIWKAVQAGSPAKGMSMADCELAMGKPDRQSERFDDVQQTDWHYDNHLGKVWTVEFINGTVERYSNYQSRF